MVLPKYLYFFPFFFSVSAFVLAFVGTACNYLQFTTTEPVPYLNGEVGSPIPISLHFGYWYYQSWTNITATSTSLTMQGSCDFYPTSLNIDKNWKAARTFNLIAIILGGSIIMLDMFQGCLSTKADKSWRLGSIGYLVCCFCSGMSLILLDSSLCKNNMLIEELNQSIIGVGMGVQFEETCSISQGGKSSIAATVLWFVAAVGTVVLHPVRRKDERNVGDDDEGLDEPLFNDHNEVL